MGRAAAVRELATLEAGWRVGGAEAATVAARVVATAEEARGVVERAVATAEAATEAEGWEAAVRAEAARVAAGAAAWAAV